MPNTDALIFHQYNLFGQGARQIYLLYGLGCNHAPNCFCCVFDPDDCKFQGESTGREWEKELPYDF